MSKKIMIVCGSPRPAGNTNTVVGWVVDAATAAGADVETVDAAKLDYEVSGCTACNGCQRQEGYRCVIDDEATPIIARIPDMDAVVFATPVYFLGPTAQLKRFVDRMYSLVKMDPEGPPNADAWSKVSLGLISTAGGAPEHGLNLVDQTFSALAEAVGRPYESLLAPGAPDDAAELAADEELHRRATEFGRRLAQA